MVEKVLVSACLLNEACRYDGKSSQHQEVMAFVKGKQVYKVCPEVLGGLTIPRSSCELVGERVMDVNGNDKTHAYEEGAKRVLAIAKKENIKLAILKSKSPSCGRGLVYDGTFSRNLVVGNGICTRILEDNAIKVINSDEIGLLNENQAKKAL